MLKIVVAHDIGRAINPMTVEGQLEGSVVQGMGYGLIEDYVINRETGVLESDDIGVRMRDLPITPEKILIALQKNKKSGKT